MSPHNVTMCLPCALYEEKVKLPCAVLGINFIYVQSFKYFIRKWKKGQLKPTYTIPKFDKYDYFDV